MNCVVSVDQKERERRREKKKKRRRRRGEEESKSAQEKEKESEECIEEKEGHVEWPKYTQGRYKRVSPHMLRQLNCVHHSMDNQLCTQCTGLHSIELDIQFTLTLDAISLPTYESIHIELRLSFTRLFLLSKCTRGQRCPSMARGQSLLLLLLLLLLHQDQEEQDKQALQVDIARPLIRLFVLVY